MRSLRSPSPAMVVAVAALFVALGGTGYAATQLGPARAASGHHKSQRGPRGPRGPRGFPGLTGPRGLQGGQGNPGAAGPGWYGGHVSILNDTSAILGYATPVGFSASESSTTNFADILSPSFPLTLKFLAVHLQNAPGAGSERDFTLLVNGTTTATCAILATSTDCTVAENVQIPPLSKLVLQSTVQGADANGADAAFVWEAN